MREIEDGVTLGSLGRNTYLLSDNTQCFSREIEDGWH